MSNHKYDDVDEEEDRGPLSDFDFDSDEESVPADSGLGIRDGSGQDGTRLVASRGGTLTIDTSAAVADYEERSRRPSDSKKVVAWRDLPKKKQLVVITLARLSEPLVQTSLQ
ncbi:hypothetical protein PC116_g33765, partial [Phytophthora cactorum]